MAAAGPHLSLKSWGPLFQVAGVLGRKALLPTSSSGSSYRGERDGGGARRKGVSRGNGGYGRGGGNDGIEGGEGESEAGREAGQEEEEDSLLWAALDALWEFAFLQAGYFLWSRRG